MKVNMICKNRYWDLEEAVNNFLRRANKIGEKIMDIKFSGEGNYSAYSTARCSVMIIME